MPFAPRSHPSCDRESAEGICAGLQPAPPLATGFSRWYRVHHAIPIAQLRGGALPVCRALAGASFSHRLQSVVSDRPCYPSGARFSGASRSKDLSEFRRRNRATPREMSYVTCRSLPSPYPLISSRFFLPSPRLCASAFHTFPFLNPVITWHGRPARERRVSSARSVPVTCPRRSTSYILPNRKMVLHAEASCDTVLPDTKVVVQEW